MHIYEPDITDRRALQIDKMYSESAFPGVIYSEVLNRAALKGNETVLDVASGNGCLVENLSDCLGKGNVIGIDRSAAMVRLARKKLIKKKAANVSIMLSTGDELLFKDSTFDVVFCVSGLYHFSDPLRGLKEMKRVLKENGQLILYEPMAPDDPKLKEALDESFQLAHPGYKSFSATELYSLAADAGFVFTRLGTVNVGQPAGDSLVDPVFVVQVHVPVHVRVRRVPLYRPSELAPV